MPRVSVILGVERSCRGTLMSTLFSEGEQAGPTTRQSLFVTAAKSSSKRDSSQRSWYDILFIHQSQN